MNERATMLLALRLREVANLYASRESATKAANLNYLQFYRYLNGTTQILLIVAMRLAELFSISIDWIATGEGNMIGKQNDQSRPHVGGLEGKVSDHVETCLAQNGLSMSESKRIELVRTIVVMTFEA
ncbi:MAG: hypothetical protein ACPGQV_07915 [Alphaproteobacteria bacterium]